MIEEHLIYLEPSLYQKYARNHKSQNQCNCMLQVDTLFSDPTYVKDRETMLSVELDDNHEWRVDSSYAFHPDM